MNQLIIALLIIGLIGTILAIVALLYGIAALRRRTIMIKKLDYLIEDVTYKSEMLNSSVETAAKMANYLDVFEVVARKNIQSLAKLMARNKEDIYKVLDRVRKLALGEQKDKRKKGEK
ncbi:hypothetical protein [Mycoplasma sp. ATU-Cv-508]|uniref:hypothetical protein n=1 Tax=Mycoplasma sp. ATU-Cv-508 TaxID=2048001 RepID=UPI000FDD826C